MTRTDDDDVVYVEREGSAGPAWFLLGLGLGAALGILFAPRRGSETRRELSRRLASLPDQARERLDDLGERVTSAASGLRDAVLDFDTGHEEEEDDDGERPAAGEAARPAAGSVREELERRLAAARARKRTRPVGGEGDRP